MRPERRFQCRNGYGRLLARSPETRNKTLSDVNLFKKKNGLDNGVHFNRLYDSLANEMLTYVTTGENGKGEKKTPPEFMHYMDQRYSDLNDIAIGFDTTVQPDYSKAFGKP
jgi:hypothetical protein